MKNLVLLVGFAVLVGGIVIGSSLIYPEDFAGSETRKRLRYLGEVMAFLYEEDMEPVSDCENIADVLKLSLKHDYIRKDQIDKGLYSRDGWGGSLEWLKMQEEGETVIRILSAGPNRVNESGGGDDYYVRLTFLANGVVKKDYKFPKRKKGVPCWNWTI
jgi:hypothetical protein